MNPLMQILSITTINLRTVPTRVGSSLVVVVGTAGVVAVLVGLLAMASGFEATLEEAGEPDRVIILRSGSVSELNGSIQLDQARVIENAPGILRNANEPVVAGETFVSLNLQRRTGEGASVPMRGIDEASFAVRPEAHVVSGRNITFGTDEVIVGIGAAREFSGLSLGDVFKVHGARFLVVGKFQTGDVHDSEIWADVNAVNAVFHRGSTFSSMTARLTSADAFEQLKQALDRDRRLTVAPWREVHYYASQSRRTANLIKGVGGVICLIMAIGAVFAALNTMYSAVSSRTVEIATLRALGFPGTPIVASVMVESMLLAVAGGIGGAALTWIRFGGYTASTMAGTYTQVAYSFDVTPDIAVGGVLLACALGLTGAIMPAIRAVRMPITRALQGE